MTAAPRIMDWRVWLDAVYRACRELGVDTRDAAELIRKLHGTEADAQVARHAGAAPRDYARTLSRLITP